MNLVFLDFETYYDDEYSLRKLTPIEYVLDPRFECHGCAIRYGDRDAFWLDGDKLPAFFDRLKEMDRVVLVTHNALFDMCIVAWRYGYRPWLMLDTLGMARALIGHEVKSLSLNSVATHFGIGGKTGALAKVKGLPLEVIKQSPELYNDYVEYACIDVTLCKGIFDRLAPDFPPSEMAIMDMILRCTIEPRFVLDENALALHLHNVQQEKANVLASAMALTGANGKEALRSNDQFAALLRAQGVEPPTKISPVTGKESYAFAKTDVDFVALTEHENPAVQALVEARMGSKSTLEESRTERLLSISRLQWPKESGFTSPGNDQPGLCPVPLKFSGAHTHRFSGDWSLNLQNLPARGGNNALRSALTAPPGMTVAVVDASQIQARLTAWLCGQEDLIQQFAEGKDVYSIFASSIFGFEVDKSVHKAERFIGKTGILSLGFQVGWKKFQDSVTIQSEAQAGKKIVLSDEEAVGVVQTYRTKYNKIAEMWRQLQAQGINVLANGGEWDVGPVTFKKGRIALPSGLHLHYHDLSYEDGQWTYYHGRYPKKTYGGHLLENLAQALERVAVMEAALRIAKAEDRPCELPLVLQGHDELVYMVPTEHVAKVREILEREMSRRPTWAPDLPLASESGEGPTYGDAK